MMRNKVFIDTNIMLYLYAEQDYDKKVKCDDALINCEWVISTQVINEFCNVCMRKLSVNAEKLNKIIFDIVKNCDINIIYLKTALKAINIKEKYKYSYYDSLILASALEEKCDVVFSEDMQDGQNIEGITIINPCK